MRTRLAGSASAQGISGTFIAEWKTGESHDWISPVHLHHDCDEAWYVLSGKMAFLIGDSEVFAEAGEFVLIPKGTVHSFRNNGEAGATYLIMMTARTKALIDELHSGDVSYFGQAFLNHGAELVEPIS